MITAEPWTFGLRGGQWVVYSEPAEADGDGGVLAVLSSRARVVDGDLMALAPEMAEALSDLMDTLDAGEIRRVTGMQKERCKQIRTTMRTVSRLLE
jgi:hypothetical protein